MFVILEKRTKYFGGDNPDGIFCFHHFENIREALKDYDFLQTRRERGQHFELVDLHSRIFCPYCGLNFQYDKYSS